MNATLRITRTLGLFASVSVLLYCSIATGCAATLPSDSSMIANFKSNRHEFNTMASMKWPASASNDSDSCIELSAVCGQAGDYNAAAVADVRRAMIAGRIFEIERNANRMPPEVDLDYKRIVQETSSVPVIIKGYAYKTDTPEYLSNNLDKPSQKMKNTLGNEAAMSITQYRKIAKNWYLFVRYEALPLF